MKNKKINLKYLFLIIPIGLILVLSLTYLANKNQIDNLSLVKDISCYKDTRFLVVLNEML